MEQSATPLHLTYRAVGTSTAIAEFVNGNNAAPASDFALGNIPLPSSQYSELVAATIQPVHLPVWLRATSVFANVPGLDGTLIDLDACLLARILQGQITTWGNQDIVARNPNLQGSTLAISVARRVRGSGTTSILTGYLRQACPDVWPSDKVGMCQLHGLPHSFV